MVKKKKKTLGLSAAEGIERARTRADANMRGTLYIPINHKNMVTVTMNNTHIDCKDLFFFSFLRKIHTNFYVEH